LEPHSDLLGFTKEDIAKYYKDHLQDWAKQNSTTVDELLKVWSLCQNSSSITFPFLLSKFSLQDLKEWYDGYRFYPGKEPLFNPYSVNSALEQRLFSAWWSNTGVSSQLQSTVRVTLVLNWSLLTQYCCWTPIAAINK